MDFELYEDTDALYLPVEMFEYIMSVSCLSQLLNLTEVHATFKILVMLEIKRRLKRMNNLIKKKGFSVSHFPICFYLGDYNNKNCGAIQGFNDINITGISFVLKFLELFGGYIKYLVCDFCGASEEQANIVFSSVGKYCINLNQIAFGNLNSSLKNSLKKPFENVEYVFIQYCRLYDRLCRLNKYFPNVKEIVFSEKNKFENIDNVLVHYKSLETMEICCGTMDIVNSVFLQLLNPKAEIFYTSEVYNSIDF